MPKNVNDNMQTTLSTYRKKTETEKKNTHVDIKNRWSFWIGSYDPSQCEIIYVVVPRPNVSQFQSRKTSQSSFLHTKFDGWESKIVKKVGREWRGKVDRHILRL